VSVQTQAAEILAKQMVFTARKLADDLVADRDKGEEKAAFEDARASVEPGRREQFVMRYGQRAWDKRLARYIRGMG
jgi:hypothetical protein